MHIGPEEAGRLDLKTYEGMLHHWNKLHAIDEPEAAPDLDRLRIFMEAHSIH